MSNSKKDTEEYQDEDIEQDDDDGSFGSNIGESPDAEKQTVVEELFNTQKRVHTLINSWSGNTKEDAIAGRKFLNNQYAALVGVINTTNSFTKRGGDECQAILYRAVKAFIVDMVNEPTIKRHNYYNLCFTYWHCLELFLGLPRNGHGARVLKDALAGLHTPDPVEDNNKGLFNNWRNNKNV
jgi:hypothetical protein